MPPDLTSPLTDDDIGFKAAALFQVAADYLRLLSPADRYRVLDRLGDRIDAELETQPDPDDPEDPDVPGLMLPDPGDPN